MAAPSGMMVKFLGGYGCVCWIVNRFRVRLCKTHDRIDGGLVKFASLCSLESFGQLLEIDGMSEYLNFSGGRSF